MWGLSMCLAASIFPLERDWQQVFIYELDVPSGIYIVQQLRENNIMNTKIFKP